MKGKVLVLGGYGNFGKRISQGLIKYSISIIIAGRDQRKAESFAQTLPASLVEIAIFDTTKDFATQLEKLCPTVVINTCGPFQNCSYDIACACINYGVHYIDLADARDFVTGITTLDEMAKTHNVAVISGASTVPGLSSAVIEHFRHEFSVLESVTYGISPGQKIERGLATTQAIMTYVGKPLKPFISSKKTVYGWQDIYRQKYPILGKRWMANCDIADLDLFPLRYGIGAIRFSAGLEFSFMHLGLWLLSWTIRLGLPLDLTRHAHLLLKLSDWFNIFGNADSGMHMIMRGKDNKNKMHTRSWFIVAKNGDGPQIPCIPAILLTKKLLLAEESVQIGAYPCVGLISLDEYLNELKSFNIHQYIQ